MVDDKRLAGWHKSRHNLTLSSLANGIRGAALNLSATLHLTLISSPLLAQAKRSMAFIVNCCQNVSENAAVMKTDGHTGGGHADGGLGRGAEVLWAVLTSQLAFPFNIAFSD